ncbi:hypothetical protein GCM10009808_14840 [Microbacterium sediminicola]|uniref:Helicase XPB/Ssl2 N-terminal domain-containing protein n=1 Tax=Microbacterium sediminicola TaxID=415210 RepID=A0ABP4U779_9MICO
MPGDERSLATSLTSLDDAALVAVLSARDISPTIGWQDFFDAAETLLEPASIDRALSVVDRATLVALRSASGSSPAASRYGFSSPDGSLLPSVRERLDAVAQSRPDAFVPAVSSGLTEASVAEQAAAAENVFTACAALADVLLAALHIPLARTGAGPVSAADRKRLIEGGAIGDADELDDLILAAAAAGLVRSIDREWVVTESGEQWLSGDTATRWAQVATGMRDALPDGIRTAHHDVAPISLWASTYPLDPAWPAQAGAIERAAARWGIVTASGGVPPWSRGLFAGDAPDTAALTAMLPAEIDTIYLQADLTAVAPGPLAPALDLRLRGIARRESRAQASTYRFTAESIGAGLTEGESEESIREFLTELSLTGIPQPLEYVISTTAARHGSLTVRSDTGTPNSIIESTEPALLDLVLVDHALRPLGLVRHEDALISRVSRDHLFWALADARYPVIALTPEGDVESLRRRTAPSVSDEADEASRYAPLLTRLRASDTTDTDAAWLGRELEQAVRARAEIVVTVRLSATDQRTFTLEATGLGGGRLRGRDRGADVERTLPVSTIVSVQPA